VTILDLGSRNRVVLLNNNKANTLYNPYIYGLCGLTIDRCCRILLQVDNIT
jgi:hypothetical protein